MTESISVLELIDQKLTQFENSEGSLAGYRIILNSKLRELLFQNQEEYRGVPIVTNDELPEYQDGKFCRSDVLIIDPERLGDMTKRFIFEDWE